MRKIILSSIVALFVLNGCGGSSSSNSKSDDSNNNINKSTGTGYYVDSAVEGIEYVCGTQSGVTDANGTFTFDIDDNCTFRIGNVVLREINASSLEDNITILENNITVGQFLQTLDVDGNVSNGITIDLNATLKSLRENNIEEVPRDKDLLDIIVSDLNDTVHSFEGKVRTEEESKEHINDTKQSLKDRGIKTQEDKALEEQEHSSNSQNGNMEQSEEGNSQHQNMREGGNSDSNGTIEQSGEGNSQHQSMEENENFDSNRTIEQSREGNSQHQSVEENENSNSNEGMEDRGENSSQRGSRNQENNNELEEDNN